MVSITDPSRKYCSEEQKLRVAKKKQIPPKRIRGRQRARVKSEVENRKVVPYFYCNMGVKRNMAGPLICYFNS
jgi:hypothetical protein